MVSVGREAQYLWDQEVQWAIGPLTARRQPGTLRFEKKLEKDGLYLLVVHVAVVSNTQPVAKCHRYGSRYIGVKTLGKTWF